jgi:hypothetical protein
MRKSRRPPPLPTFVLVRDAFPHLAKPLAASLRKRGHPELATQVPDLRIYGRCPCKARNCGTVYCVPPEEYKRLVRLVCAIGDVWVARGTIIIEVETLDSEVDAVLDRLFPDLPDTNRDA